MRSKPFTVHCIQKFRSSNTNLKVHFLFFFLKQDILRTICHSHSKKFNFNFICFVVTFSISYCVASAFTCLGKVVYLLLSREGWKLLLNQTAYISPGNHPVRPLFLIQSQITIMDPFFHILTKPILCTELINLVPLSSEGSQTL